MNPHMCGCRPRSQTSALPLTGTEVSNTSTNPVCDKDTDPDLAPAAAQAHTMPGTRWQHMLLRSVGSTALGHQEICMWRPRSWESLWPLGATQAVEISPETVVGPQTQTCPWQQSRPGCHHGPRRHCRSPRSAWPKWQHVPQTQTCPQVAAQTPGIHSALYGNRSQLYQHGPCLW